MRLSFRLARLWIRNRRRRTTALLVGVATAGLVLLYIVLNAFALSGAQIAQQSMGDHEYQISFPGGSPGRPVSDESHVLSGMEKNGARSVTVQVTSMDLVVDGARTTGLTTGMQTVVTYREVPRGVPTREVDIRSGRAPSGGREVALSADLDKRLKHPSRITVFSGAATLQVVGVFVDPYATDALSVYGGPGLWQALPQAIRNSFPSTESSIEVSWNGMSLDKGAGILSRVSGVPVDSLINGSRSRAFYLSSSQRSLTQRIPGVFTYPSLGLMALAGIVMVAMLMPGFRAEMGAIAKLGVPKRPVLGGILVAVAGLVVLAVAGGGLCGVVLGWLARRWLVPRLLTQPISPLPALAGLLLRLGVACLLPALACAAAMVMPRAARRPRRRRAARMPVIRRIVAAGGLAWCLYRLVMVHSVEDALVLGIVMTVVALVVLPDVVSVVVHLPLPRTVNGWISQRLIRAQVGRVATVAMLLCGCLALPCSLTVLVTSIQVSNAAQALVPKGQLSLQTPSGVAPPASLVRAVERRSGLSRPILVGTIAGVVDGSASNCFGVMVISSADDLERLNGGSLDESARARLDSGGLVDISGATADLTLVPDKGKPLRMPTAHTAFQPSWAEKYAAVMLESTALRMKTGVQTDAYVYTGVTDRQIDLAKKAVFSAGGDPRTVNYHIDPEPPPIPWEWWLAVGALSAVALFATFVATRSLGTDLRQHTAQFLAIGLPPATGRSVLAAELGVLVIATVPVTVAVGILPTALVAAVNKGLELSVPSAVLALAAGVLVGAVVISGAGAMTGVRARERTVDALI